MSKEVEIYDGDELLCPECGESSLHQVQVSAFFRRAEDSLEGVLAIVEGADQFHEPRVRVSGDAAIGNPSLRRDGLLIYFECEQGCSTSVLSISQHKGRTYIRWEVPEASR